ncbi:MAG: HAMP domain-containing histidine kinase [Clostridia bacterium]|nr:HAMP domain-containing histidine kinase [Clostridia bacterium]
MTKSGITKRWLLTTILVIAIILLLIDTGIIVLLKNYYYNTVERKLQTLGQSSAVADFFSSYIGASNDIFSSRANEYVENFSDINVAEVWVLNKNGEVIVTSTGFIAQTGAGPDYEQALALSSGRAFWTGQMPSGEKVMAMTTLLPLTNGASNGAVRYIISLELVDRQIVKLSVMSSVICLFAIVLVLISGMFFVRSIVGPVKRLNDAARNIAAGNFSQRVELPNRYDELAELSESINYMTAEIDKTSKMKNDFISTVSHELRTPLTAIKGWAETLLSVSETQDKTMTDGLKVIVSETDHLYSLVEDLLDFSKIESGRMTLFLQPVDVLAELEDAVSALRDRADRRGITLVYSAPEAAAPMNADPDRLKQVFVNLLDNAVKYTEEGGRITVTAEKTAGGLKIVFADNGCGIAEEDLPHVTEKFYKANISVKGSGIGLAVCEEIIGLHKGTLTIKSKLGEGTQVTVTLPVTVGTAAEGKDN